ncbi:MlaE family lipid ABC transporter permease subunit [Zestomonas thermotolerans]|jgi:phospholipid/cholesterol/gamma-HCH transport system permease protein|uniref:MlaE family lipid ABC transporter permease subunit n=1 Tax=Zestomonas thermotolerans TaxID=157784 RepID=UPI0023F25439|nr:MlaE family lipid ABC transporter permease subunit [Pseudomonas thermotolerans]MBO2509852.1 ABC transporter permease [Gammaproteobacteria bacterium]
MPQPGTLELETATTPPRLRIRGDWTLAHYVRLRALIDESPLGETGRQAEVDLAELGQLDTAGAALLGRWLGEERLLEVASHTPGLPAERLALLRTVVAALRGCPGTPGEPAGPAAVEVLGHIGDVVSEFGRQAKALLGFIGLSLESLLRTLPRPRRWRITSLVAHLEQVGLNAIPIIALLTFMVGAVVAFLGATVLADFGATLYTVHLVAFSFLREFGVLLTAILMAGRTASAFTAQIGSMKANEEIDAIRTLGLDPMELLVLPRLLAMLISLPILTFIAMLCGIVGGGLVSTLMLDVSPAMFLSVLQSDIPVRHFFIGLVKAPLFAFLIATIGCLEGFKASGSAKSVGDHTTSSVVQSIFVVILLDALAALFFMEMGW